MSVEVALAMPASRRKRRPAHVVMAHLTVPLDQQQLREGQDMALVSATDLLAGRLWNPRLQSFRPLAGLAAVMATDLGTAPQA